MFGKKDNSKKLGEKKLVNTSEASIKENEGIKVKTFDNSNIDQAKKQVRDIKVFGNGDIFKLISKASSKEEGWMKSTKAMQTPRGCLVQVTTQQGINIAEALAFVPDVVIKEDKNGNKYLG
tara:strand:+ start:7532 stop:7894 length:363 start_codon:yes stop_codon:yes gene_type:complete